MDIKKLTPVAAAEDEGVFVHFEDAADRPMYDGEAPIGAVVSGTYSTHYRAANRKIRERSLARGQQRGATDAVTVDQIDDNAHELEVACIRSWTFEADGKPFPITVQNWKALLEMQPQWREQVNEAMHAHARFFERSATR